MLYSPLLVRMSATSLPLYCSKSLTSRDSSEGFTRAIGDWEAKSVLNPMMHGTMAVPLDGLKAAESPITRNYLNCLRQPSQSFPIER
jgi:hypothetical protein